MKKLAIVLFLISLLQIQVYSNSESELLKPIEVAKNLYAIENPQGGNIGFLITEGGIIVVDAGASPTNGMQIIESIRSISDKPIKYVIYTHLHGDHIYGIGSFPAEVKIIAHEQLVENFKNIIEPQLKNNIEKNIPDNISKLTRLMDSIPDKKSEEYMNVLNRFNSYSSYFEELKKIQIRYPDITFRDKYELVLGNEKVILEFLGSGHTNDNIIVRFPKEKTIHTADLIFNGRIPYVLAAHGATVKGWIDVLDKLSAEENPTVKVIPGHGSVTNGEAFKTQSDYFKKLTEKVSALKNEGKSLGEIKKSINVNEFGLKGNENQFPLNIEVIYNEL